MEEKDNIVENWLDESTRKLLDKDSVEFYFKQAEESLKYSIRDSKVITDRCYALGGMLLTVFIALLGIIASFLVNDSGNKWILVLSLEGLVTCSIAMFILLIKIMRPHEYSPCGREPKEMGIPEFVKYYSESGMPVYENIVMNELLVYQHRIESNDQTNAKRVRHAGIAMNVVICGICIVVITLLVAFFIENFPGAFCLLK